MVISILASAKLVSTITKEMVQTEAVRGLAHNLYSFSKRVLANSMQQSPGPTTSGGLHNENLESTEYLVYNWLEGLFTWFQMIILWHDPYQSLFTFAGLSSSFLLLTYIAPRFYTTILIAIFVYNLTKFWFRHVWPEIRVPPTPEADQESRLDVDRFAYLHPQMMTLDELNRLVSNLIGLSKLYLNKMIELRHDRPGSFCLLICSLLSCTAIIGNSISGLNLILCIATALLSAPGIYIHVLPLSVKQYLKQTTLFTLFQTAIQESRESHMDDQQDDFVIL